MILSYDAGMQLTKNFKLGEFMVTQHPHALENVVLRHDEILKCYYFCVFCLQPTRDRWGPLRLTSGFRTMYLNQLVGGSDSSQHCWCEAVDFVPEEANAEQVWTWMKEALCWPGELILYPDENRIHVAMPHPLVHADCFIKRTRVQA